MPPWSRTLRWLGAAALIAGVGGIFLLVGLERVAYGFFVAAFCGVFPVFMMLRESAYGGSEIDGNGGGDGGGNGG